MDNLIKLTDELKIAVEEKNSNNVPKVLDSVLTQVESGEKGNLNIKATLDYPNLFEFRVSCYVCMREFSS